MLNYTSSPLTLIKTLIQLTLALSYFLLVNNVIAKDYKIEVILFERLQAGAASESHHYDAPREMKHKANHWLLEPSLLLKEAESLNQSDQFLVQRHYAWGVESLPYEQSANYTIIEAQSQGYIKVYAAHLLFTNIDLDYKGFRMHEKRRLKLDEKHYFDHPKFGILMQVSRLEEKKADAEDQSLEGSR